MSMEYVRKTQKGSGNCCGKACGNRIAPIYDVIEFTDVYNFVPPTPSDSIISATTIEVDVNNNITFKDLPYEIIEKINEMTSSCTSTTCKPTPLMLTSHFNFLYKPFIDNAVNRYFDSPEFNKLFTFFLTGNGWCELCVYPIFHIKNQNNYKTFEFYIEYNPDKLIIYHLNTTENDEVKEEISVAFASVGDKYRIISILKEEMLKCVRFILNNNSFNSLYFVTWLDLFYINKDDQPPIAESIANSELVGPLLIENEKIQDALANFVRTKGYYFNINAATPIPLLMNLIYRNKDSHDVVNLEGSGVNRRKLKLRRFGRRSSK